MKLQTLFVVLITAVMLLPLLLGGCLKEPSLPLRVGTVVWPGYENLYLAQNLGYYKNTSIRFRTYAVIT
ncbi:MAG: hypothetical protein NVS2B14_22080 [Chamaesiphon sp.]